MLVEKALFSLAYLGTLVLGNIVDGTLSDSENIVGASHRNGEQTPLQGDFKTSLLSESTLVACIKAPNCETYEGDHGTMIRFVAGEEPGSANYQKRFGTNGSVKPPSSDGAPSVNEAQHLAFDGGIHTNIDLGQTGIIYGSTRPYDAIHYIYDHCGQSTCNPASFSVDTSSVRSTGSRGNTVVSGYTLSVSVTGEYDGYAQREVFVQALLAASGQGLQTANERWRYRNNDGDVETGTLVVYFQMGYIGVNRFDSSGALHGFMSVQVTQDTASSNWCSSSTGILSAVVGLVNPLAGGFFGVVSAECSANGH